MMSLRCVAALVGVALACAGCKSPYYADQGALFGGLTGAGVGALVGDSVGEAGAGAAIGAGVGALTGAAVGSSLDEIDARNRAQIAQQLGRPVSSGAVTVEEVIAMSQAGVAEPLIASHIRNNGVVAPPTTDDLLRLSSAGVPTSVIQAMQSPPRPVAVAPAPTPVIVEEYHYGPPPYYYHPHDHFHYRHRHRPRPHVGWGVSFSSH
jgi:hypothetical protein